MKFKAILIVAFVLALGPLAHAQLAPTPAQGSTAAEASHLFTGTGIQHVTASWNAATTARYFMIFDGPLPSNGATTACSVTQAASCLMWCEYATTSGTAPSAYVKSFGLAPLLSTNKTGITVAMSTGAGCGTLTADTTSNFFYAQMAPR